MKRALLSVSDKNNIVEFAKSLIDEDFEIVSTGGTFNLLKEHGVKAIEIDEITQFPECFEGRVKTLNPYIHGGILYRRDKETHVNQAQQLNVHAIDLVCVNLYPFKQTIQKTDNFEEIIENIDIGGPTMVRAAAKNYNDVIIVTSPDDYNFVIKTLHDDKNTLEFRRELMIKAYEHTAAYDSMIANYMNQRFNNGFGNKQFIVGDKVTQTRYGENPHQKGALYEFDKYFSRNFKTLKGEASFNNLTDINSAVKIASAFKNEPAVCIVKHGNPCGFAIKDNLLDAYTQALKCDPISAYGGVVAINGVLDAKLAMKINEIFIEVIVAAHITQDAVDVFANKKRIKLFEYGSDAIVLSDDKYDFKHIDGGFVYQESDKVEDNEVLNSKQVSNKKATKQELKDMEIAYKVASLTKSNCVVYVKDSAMVAVGMGMTSRVDSAQCALKKADELGLDVTGSVLASEAFFPFRDSIDAAAKAGVSAVIEPGGSIRDEDIIQAANEYGISLYFSNKRHFLH